MRHPQRPQRQGKIYVASECRKRLTTVAYRLQAFQALRHPDAPGAARMPAHGPSGSGGVRARRAAQAAARESASALLQPASLTSRASSAPAPRGSVDAPSEGESATLATGLARPVQRAVSAVPTTSPQRAVPPVFFHDMALPRVLPLTQPRASYRSESPLTPLKHGSSDSFPGAPAPGAYEEVFANLGAVSPGRSPPSSVETPLPRGDATEERQEVDVAVSSARAVLPPSSDGPIPIKPIQARMREYGRALHDTPHSKSIRPGNSYRNNYTGEDDPPSPIRASRYDIGLGRHLPPPSPVDKGAPWPRHVEGTDEPPMALINEWYAAGRPNPNNRFMHPRTPPRPGSPTIVDVECHGAEQPARRQPNRAASIQRPPLDPHVAEDIFEESVKPIVEESDVSDDDDGFVLPPNDPASDNDDSDLSDRPTPEEARARTKAKGKAPQRNASAAGSDSTRGRPTIGANQEIERMGHRIQGELATLAGELGMSYDTVIRKMGFSQQGVREPTLGNVFRKVHKQRLLASGQGRPV